jgi:hypothetical protein
MAAVSMGVMGSQAWLRRSQEADLLAASNMNGASARTFTLATWNVLADGLAQSGGWIHVRRLQNERCALHFQCLAQLSRSQ